MQDVVDQADLAILLKAGMSEEDVRHSILVAQKAVDIARRTGVPLDLRLVRRGALFHDLGKSLTHSYQHGELGADVARRFNLPEEIAEIARKHFHGGITPAEALALGLPVRDHTPQRLEERIVFYADRLVDIITEGYFTFGDEAEAERRFEEIVTTHRHYGKDRQTSERYVAYHREIAGLIRRAGERPRDQG